MYTQRISRSARLLTLLAVALLTTGFTAHAQKKGGSAPAKPAAKPATPAPKAGGAAGGAAGHAGGATTAAHTTGGATTAGHATTTTAGHAAGGGMAGGARAGGAMGGGGAHGGVAGVHSGGLAHGGPAGSHDHVGAGGSAYRTRANGRPSDVHDARRGMDIHHNLAGGRRVSMERRDGSHLYYERGRAGYISHGYAYHGHEFARRSYYYHGRAYDRFYNHYGYHGYALDVYAPAAYWAPGFYGWAYNPWAVPVAYAWGWGAAPWYGFYGAYFTPYAVYGSPSLWLTDYLISASLQAAYEAHMADAAAAAEVAGAAPPAPLDPATKQFIADEVAREVALENAEAQQSAAHQDIDPASSSIARMFSDGKTHVFIPGKEVDVTDASGQECAVTDGDVLQTTTPPPPEANTAVMTVLSSKGGVECRRGAMVNVALDDLQEMQNHLRETLDQGLTELQAKQGTGGLPRAPQSAMAAPAVVDVAQGAPPPDPAGAADLAAQAQGADQAEQEVMAANNAGPAGGPSAAPVERAPAAAPAPPAAPAQPVNIALGQSIADVTGQLGQPKSVINLAGKTIYVYPDMKITFKAGKVSDVQ